MGARKLLFGGFESLVAISGGYTMAAILFGAANDPILPTLPQAALAAIALLLFVGVRYVRDDVLVSGLTALSWIGFLSIIEVLGVSKPLDGYVLVLAVLIWVSLYGVWMFGVELAEQMWAQVQ